jgi:hypothetical protein
MPLDWIASQAVYAAAQGLRTAHLFEAAANFADGWTMTYAGVTVEAERKVCDTGVLFVASFPEMCWIDTPEDTTAYLQRNGEVMGFRQITHPGDCAFGIRWDLETEREHSDLPSR